LKIVSLIGPLVSQNFPFLFKTVIWHMASVVLSESQNCIQLKML